MTRFMPYLLLRNTHLYYETTIIILLIVKFTTTVQLVSKSNVGALVWVLNETIISIILIIRVCDT